MKKILLCIITSVVCLNSQAESTLNTDKEKFSYSVGIQLAQNMLRQSIQVDPDAFVQAVRDVLTGSQLKLTPQQMQQVLISYQQQAMEQQQAQGQKNKLAGEKFLSENKKKTGIIETNSGLQYKILKQGNGKKPSVSDSVVVHYRGTLIDGKEFDSSYARGEPLTLSASGVIKGWQEVLPMMQTGSKWQIYVPSELAYGERGAGPDIGPHSALIFDIELLAIK